MTELEDLRGATINWMVSRWSPLLCALSSSTGSNGSLVQDDATRPVDAWLATVAWRIEHGKAGSTVRFGSEGPVVATTRGSVLTSFEAEIDGIAHYDLTLLSSEGKAVWLEGRRQAVILRRHHASTRCESGEIIVSRTCTLEHVPILVLLGLDHIVRRPRLLLAGEPQRKPSL